MSDKDLFAAIGEGSLELARTILERDPSAAKQRNDAGISPLMMALYHRQPEIASLVRKHLAEADLFEAAALGDVDHLRKHIAKNPDAITVRSPDGFSALHLAAFFGHAKVVDLLLKAGADVNAVADNSTSVQPLHSAVAGADFRTVKLLHDAGADIDGRQQQGFTPLMAAAANGRKEILSYLVEAGADLTLRSEDGKTAMDHARFKGQKEAEAYLESKLP